VGAHVVLEVEGDVAFEIGGEAEGAGEFSITFDWKENGGGTGAAVTG